MVKKFCRKDSLNFGRNKHINEINQQKLSENQVFKNLVNKKYWRAVFRRLTMMIVERERDPDPDF